MSITLVVGLGNPGREYTDTRHNLGATVVDGLAAAEQLAWKQQSAFDAAVARWDRPGLRPVLLVKPTTFMNESGRAVRALASYYKLPNAAIAVVYDDLTISLGLVKVTEQGSAGGHNGIASLLEHIGSGFLRYRLGIGPKEPAEMDLKDFVLGRFSPAQRLLVEQQFPTYLAGLRLLIDSGPAHAMNSLNRRVQNEPEQP
jgi:PTH1 family peptidyl-tRNA hydrolase